MNLRVNFFLDPNWPKRSLSRFGVSDPLASVEAHKRDEMFGGRILQNVDRRTSCRRSGSAAQTTRTKVVKMENGMRLTLHHSSCSPLILRPARSSNLDDSTFCCWELDDLQVPLTWAPGY